MSQATKNPDVDPDNLETPTDDAVPKPRRKQQRRNRYQCFDDGEGDYRIMAIASTQKAEEHGIPPTSFLHLPDVPGFECLADAKKYLRNSAGDLEGLQLIIIRGFQIFKVEVENKPRIKLTAKVRKVRKRRDEA